MDWKEIVISGRIKVIFKKAPQFHSVSTGILIKAGSRFETPEISGISHFVEHLLFKGTKKRSCNRIKEEIEGVGGTFNGFTSEEVTCYWIKILKNYFDLGMDVLSDMVQNPLMKEEDIEKERKVIIEEINMYRDIPAKYVFEIFDRQLFSNHSLGQPVAGTAESVTGISRKNLLDYTYKFYNSENIVVSIAGNVSEQQVSETASKYLSRFRQEKESVFEEWNRKPEGPRITNIRKKTEQTHIAMGGMGISRFDERRYALNLLDIILGGNMSSRLFNRIREDMGLAYAIKSMTGFYNDTGVYVIYAGVSPENAEKCISAVVDELKKIKEKGVRASELERAKRFLSSQFLMRLEDNTEYMLWLGEQKISGGRISGRNEILRKIDSVDSKGILSMAEELFTSSNFYVSLIGPKADESEILKTAESL